MTCKAHDIHTCTGKRANSCRTAWRQEARDQPPFCQCATKEAAMRKGGGTHRACSLRAPRAYSCSRPRTAASAGGASSQGNVMMLSMPRAFTCRMLGARWLRWISGTFSSRSACRRTCLSEHRTAVVASFRADSAQVQNTQHMSSTSNYHHTARDTGTQYHVHADSDGVAAGGEKCGQVKGDSKPRASAASRVCGVCVCAYVAMTTTAARVSSSLGT